MDVGTQTHLHALRELLLNRKHELEDLLRAAEQARAAGGVPEAGEERDRQRLAGVEAAIQRLDQGTYGDCLQCGRPIPFQRLLVQPAAERCAACQAVFDGSLRP